MMDCFCYKDLLSLYVVCTVVLQFRSVWKCICEILFVNINVIVLLYCLRI